jgi:Porin subfamily
MDTARNLILGTVAGLMAVSAAQAADLPVKAKPIEYMKFCSAFGPGFFFIPGTDTCMKIGGYLRVDTTFNGGIQGTPAWNGDAGQHNLTAS